MNFDMSNVSRGFSRGKLLVNKHSPEILLGVGIAGVITAAVMAAKATLKIDEVKAEQEQMMASVQEAVDTVPRDKYSEDDMNQDLLTIKVRTALNYTKLYLPSGLLMGASIAAILGSHNIMEKRTVSIMAAYSLLQEGFRSYRDRVVDELGPDEDRRFRFGISSEEATETVVNKETGRKNKKKVTKDVMDPNAKSDYARFFDEFSNQYRNDPALNLTFLKAQQNYFNDMLKIRGHVFLNEVYDALNIPRSQAGTIVGWVLGGGGDDFIDFGIYDYDSRAFINGYERAILLDFNVDGIIYDLI